MIGSLAAAAALLLALAGLAKVVTPAPAVTTLRLAYPALRGMRTLRAVVRAGGVAELAIGLAALTVGSRLTAVLLGCCYLVFAALAVRLVRRGQHAPCGCFGQPDSPIGIAHVVLNVICVGGAIAATLRPPGPAGGLFEHGALPGVVGAAQVVLLAYLGFLSVTALPALAAERRRLVEMQ
jgi:hypothetical protein